MGRRPATARMPPGHRADVARTLPDRHSDAARTLPGRRLDAPLGAARTPSVPAAKCLYNQRTTSYVGMFPGSLGASLGGMEAVSRRCPDVIRAAFGQRPSSVRTTPHPAPTDPSNIQKSMLLYRFYKHFQAGLDGVQTASREAIRRGQGGVWAASERRPSGDLVASGRPPGRRLDAPPDAAWAPSVSGAKCL